MHLKRWVQKKNLTDLLRVWLRSQLQSKCWVQQTTNGWVQGHQQSVLLEIRQIMSLIHVKTKTEWTQTVKQKIMMLIYTTQRHWQNLLRHFCNDNFDINRSLKLEIRNLDYMFEKKGWTFSVMLELYFDAAKYKG